MVFSAVYLNLFVVGPILLNKCTVKGCHPSAKAGEQKQQMWVQAIEKVDLCYSSLWLMASTTPIPFTIMTVIYVKRKLWLPVTLLGNVRQKHKDGAQGLYAP